MKLNTETKVGLLAIVAIALFVLGFNFMKNISIFGKSFELRSFYDNVEGLIIGNPVFLNGKRIGQVRVVEMKKETGRIEVIFTLEKGLKIPIDSKAVIVSDLFGSMKVRLDRGVSPKLVENGATLLGVREETLQERVMKEILPLKDNISNLLSQMEQFVGWMNNTMDESARNKIDNILDDLRITAHGFATISNSVNTLVGSIQLGLDNANKIVANLKNQNDMISRIMSNTAMFTDSLAYSSTNVRTMIKQTSDAIGNLQEILAKAKSPDNTLGKVLNDTLLYSNLNKTISRVDSFLVAVQRDGVKLKHKLFLGDPDKPKKKKGELN